jgi:hypothetical protein
MLILIGYVVLGGVISLLVFQRGRIKQELFAATRQAAHARARQGAAEERYKELAARLEASLLNTQQALNVAQGVEVVGERVANLITYVTQPELEGAPYRALDGSEASVANGYVRYQGG